MDEQLGYMMLLPVGVRRTACAAFGCELHSGLIARIGGISIESANRQELDAAVVLGNPRRDANSRRLYHDVIEQMWAGLPRNGTLLVGGDTMVGRTLRGPRGVGGRYMGTGGIRRMIERLRPATVRCCHVYPSVSRPVLIMSADADAVTRTAVLGAGGQGRRLSLLAAVLKRPLAARLLVPGIVWIATK